MRWSLTKTILFCWGLPICLEKVLLIVEDLEGPKTDLSYFQDYFVCLYYKIEAFSKFLVGVYHMDFVMNFCQICGGTKYLSFNIFLLLPYPSLTCYELSFTCLCFLLLFIILVKWTLSLFQPHKTGLVRWSLCVYIYVCVYVCMYIMWPYLLKIWDLKYIPLHQGHQTCE